MSEPLPPPAIGTIGWLDLTTDQAPELSDFYQRVVGWKKQPLSMGDYDDYVMVSPTDGVSCSGICHARGINADLPAVWLAYVVVADLGASLQACRDGGGEIIIDRRQTGGGDYAVIKDPAGAHIALFQTKAPATQEPS